MEVAYTSAVTLSAKTDARLCRFLLESLPTLYVLCQPDTDKKREDFQKRMIRVLHNHAHFESCPGLWLFVALTRKSDKYDCEFYTLNEDLTGFVPIYTDVAVR
jgi:hypothetical protein